MRTVPGQNGSDAEKRDFANAELPPTARPECCIDIRAVIFEPIRSAWFSGDPKAVDRKGERYSVR
jgi:hypothetical protein